MVTRGIDADGRQNVHEPPRPRIVPEARENQRVLQHQEGQEKS